MARYYTKQLLKVRVEQLEKATGCALRLIGCNGEYALEYRGADSFPGLGCYHSVKYCIIYIEGILEGIKLSSNKSIKTEITWLQQKQNMS